jgi:hypothetical protein
MTEWIRSIPSLTPGSDQLVRSMEVRARTNKYAYTIGTAIWTLDQIQGQLCKRMIKVTFFNKELIKPNMKNTTTNATYVKTPNNAQGAINSIRASANA